MTAPTLTSEQREAQKAMRQALAEALHEGLDGDFLIEAGMGADNEGENVGISEVQPKELVWWAVYQVAPVVAVMVADAAHEAEAKVEMALRMHNVQFDRANRLAKELVDLRGAVEATQPRAYGVVHVSECVDMEEYARISNEGYALGLQHAQSAAAAARMGASSQMRWESGRDAAVRAIKKLRKAQL